MCLSAIVQLSCIHARVVPRYPVINAVLIVVPNEDVSMKSLTTEGICLNVPAA